MMIIKQEARKLVSMWGRARDVRATTWCTVLDRASRITAARPRALLLGLRALPSPAHCGMTGRTKTETREQGQGPGHLRLGALCTC